MGCRSSHSRNSASVMGLRRARFMEPSVYHELAMGATERAGRAGLRTRVNGIYELRKAESMGLLIRSLPDGRLALRTHATFAVAASAGPLFPDRGQTESGRRGSQAERDSAVVRVRHDRRVRQLRRHR